MLGGRARQWLLSKPRVFQRCQQTAGAALVGLGIKVALERAR
jgi:threonine/homoserine/homoserine lactone efflux protein